MNLNRPPRSMIWYLVGNVILIVVGILGVSLNFFVSEPSNLVISIRAIGSAVAASGFVGFVYYFYLRHEKRYEDAISLIDEWGVLDIREGRGRSDTESYREAMIECENQLDIQAISLRRFQTDLGDTLDRLGERGVHIRLLLLDPKSDICDWYEEADSDYSDLKSQIHGSTNEFLERDIDTLEIRYYTGLPVNYFRADDRIFLGPYFARIPSRNTITFLADMNKKLAEGYQENFEDHWEHYSEEVS